MRVDRGICVGLFTICGYGADESKRAFLSCVIALSRFDHQMCAREIEILGIQTGVRVDGLTRSPLAAFAADANYRKMPR